MDVLHVSSFDMLLAESRASNGLLTSEDAIMLYGYSSRTVNEEYGLLEMREITFDASPTNLRKIARFLEKMADVIETGQAKSSHAHINSVIDSWDREHPNKGIVVILRRSAPPPRVRVDPPSP